ncbi:bifunctional phosphopantothenoylcysteine decarboxylase/phosphopantothenate--cysteine ligase CoaBC [Yimella sp. cx-51]|uniref:bifunctional phosphopantothenoylcysteine decarboxylase/phosphopantothenate--cysteine ligase CoaBC n=1 Tax=Yimella sp. cx-51 TaxID=2770551 RepID=UPI00165D7EB5|nr:bifunctional phosphopantothenoylcysteine decarboxylase/phosphopantothenate--cysteine ligase CoaBC [Yimella sp. cx-51]MBC9957503.1 bifunctional phosphopantothenoylcysteine decarboxylase/phosphopantothenate--cysteine ligase CoaBC [Yimella sp. cx-51]QTH39266.1 bifunctional phosphopantothenoylcysteine decarboxylase/phosphopantothenate--cysteine ligase CoaBC [Yimella sp. cx-51]
MRIVLGVAGGIAAYKSCTLLRRFTESGHDVTVVPTAAALQFVGAATWSALSGKPVHTEVWDDVHQVPHVRIGQQAELVVVAPATADLLAKAAHGLADDLLTNTLLTARCPVVLAPAMHTEMWTNAATQTNVATLRERGVDVIDPASGRLTGADTGPGRLPEPEDIFEHCRSYLDAAERADGPLAGKHVVITAGGTREPLDPVRFLGNRSSGKQGFALAASAAKRGARVTLISTSSLIAPGGVDLVPVETARQMEEAVRRQDADVIVMAAAVADFRPASVANAKIKKGFAAGDPDAPTVELVRNPDILAGLVERRGSATTPYLVGFAAETGDAEGDVLHHARAKLARKKCDLLVANEVGEGLTFGQDTSTVHLLRADSEAVTIGPADKSVIADAIWDAVQQDLP